MADDIDANPFFVALKTALSALYDDAAVHQKTICVPHADSFNPKLINKDFAGTCTALPACTINLRAACRVAYFDRFALLRGAVHHY